MKKLLIFVFVIPSFLLVAQQKDFKSVSSIPPRFDLLIEAPSMRTMQLSDDQTFNETTKTIKNTNSYFVQLGSSISGYSTAFQGNTFLWADPILNSAVFTHRMDGPIAQYGGDIAYDISTDGGFTWQLNNQVYESEPIPDEYEWWPARFPQGAIINTEGNINPENAYYSYFSGVWDDGSNNIWGGYAFGSNVLTTLPPEPTQTNWTSENETWRLNPSAFHVTQQGVAWYFDESSKYNPNTDEYEYTGKLILGRGEIVDGEIEYTEELLSFLSPGEVFLDFKMAFAPDGQTGYLLILGVNSASPVPYTNYHPILLKTLDGGETWGEPIDVQLGGENGIEKIKNYIDSSIIANLGGYENWDGNRDSLYFNMGYHVDMAVDAAGNPYLLGLISLATDDGSWFPQMGTEWAVYSKDGGDNWDADALWDQFWFEGMVGDLTLYNRPQVSIDYKGKVIFYSWSDSEVEQAEENNMPNIYQIGYHIGSDSYSEIDNLTYFTQAWNRAFMASASYYVFNWGEYDFSVPYTFVEFTVEGDPLSSVNHWYLVKEIYPDMLEFQGSVNSLILNQNFPNPASSQTEIIVTAITDSPIELTINNMLGKIVYTDQVKSNAHAHSFSINVADFEPGIYLYSVKVGNRTVTKKMLVD